MDYKGLYRDLKAMRDRAMGDGGWCAFGGNWKQLARFIDEIDRFTDDLDYRDAPQAIKQLYAAK